MHDEPRRSLVLGWLAKPLKAGALNAKARQKAAKDLGLSERSLPDTLSALASAGHLTVTQVPRSTEYRRTAAGTEWLAAHPPPRRVAAPRAARTPRAPKLNEPSNPGVQQARELYLLMQPLLAPGGRIAKADLNRANARWKALDFNAATADRDRGNLAARGWLASDAHQAVVLTDQGLRALAALRFPETAELKLSGRVLNALLTAARGAGAFVPPPPPPPMVFAEPPAPPQEDVIHAIQNAFGQLRREVHWRSGMVPIHEVRSAVRQRLGAEAAGAAFDAAAKALRGRNQVRLVPINELSQATPEELRASIRGANETLFFMESADVLPRA